MSETDKKSMPLPIMVAVSVGRGVLQPGDPRGDAIGVFEFDVAHGLCVHEVVLEITKRLSPVVDKALRNGMEAAKKAQEGGNGNDQGSSNLVA